jgi:biopolymer transport protein ExbD
MRVTTQHKERKEENLVPLINVVFLILIFFLVASTIRPYSDRDISLAETINASKSAPAARMVIVRGDGQALVGGFEVDASQLDAQIAEWARDRAGAITVVADKAAPAARLIEVVTLANTAGVSNVKLLTRKGR